MSSVSQISKEKLSLGASQMSGDEPMLPSTMKMPSQWRPKGISLSMGLGAEI